MLLSNTRLTKLNSSVNSNLLLNAVEIYKVFFYNSIPSTLRGSWV